MVADQAACDTLSKIFGHWWKHGIDSADVRRTFTQDSKAEDLFCDAPSDVLWHVLWIVLKFLNQETLWFVNFFSDKCHLATKQTSEKLAVDQIQWEHAVRKKYVWTNYAQTVPEEAVWSVSKLFAIHLHLLYVVTEYNKITMFQIQDVHGEYFFASQIFLFYSVEDFGDEI